MLLPYLFIILFGQFLSKNMEFVFVLQHFCRIFFVSGRFGKIAPNGSGIGEGRI